MALARDLSLLDRFSDGSAARALPSIDHAPAPVRGPSRPKRRIRRTVTMAALGWACFMAISMVLVYINAQALEETAAITRIREEMARLEQQNQELQSQVAQAVSLAEVERWAVAQGMRRPQTVQTLQGDTRAIAGPMPAQSDSLPDLGQSVTASVWKTVQAYVSRVGHFVGAIARAQ